MLLLLRSHTFPLITLPYLLGVSWTAAGLLMRPQMSEPVFSFASDLLSLSRNATGYYGRLAMDEAGVPAGGLNVTVMLRSTQHTEILVVNGQQINPIPRTILGVPTWFCPAICEWAMLGP